MTHAIVERLLRYAEQNADRQGFARLPIPTLGIMRAHAPTPKIHALYRPVLCLVLQGAKTVLMGQHALDFAEGQSLVVSADTPVIGRVTQASRTRPYLALSVDLDMALMRELSAQIGAMDADATQTARSPGAIDTTEPQILACAQRLIAIMDEPEARSILGPGIVREMHYWLLTGVHAARIRNAAMPDSHSQRIGRAVALLRRDFAFPVTVEALAAEAGMSPSAFHQHFRGLTSLAPMQFRQQLRLLEARRLMLNEGQSTTAAALAVGYESLSQFTREYGRMFGAPPRRDIASQRNAA